MNKRFITLLATIFAITSILSAQTTMDMPNPNLPMGRVPEKKPGTIRVGISMPVAEMGKDFTFADTPMAVMNTLQVALTDDNVETIFLQSALPEREAKQNKCDYVFISKVTRKKGGGGFGGLGMLGGMRGRQGSLLSSKDALLQRVLSTVM